MGAWIEIQSYLIYLQVMQSHPTMGAWIEIMWLEIKVYLFMSHPTMGAWIEIAFACLMHKCIYRRTPRWVRGLKY